MNRLCEDYGLYIKVYFGKIIIYDIDRYESKKAVATYHINDFGDGWSYNTTLTGTYTGATIKYTSVSANTLKTGWRMVALFIPAFFK